MDISEKYFNLFGLEKDASIKQLEDKYITFKERFKKQASSENTTTATSGKNNLEKLENVYKILHEHISRKNSHLEETSIDADNIIKPESLLSDEITPENLDTTNIPTEKQKQTHQFHTCVVCGKAVSLDASKCLNCGKITPWVEKRKEHIKTAITSVITVSVLILIVFYINKSDIEDNNFVITEEALSLIKMNGDPVKVRDICWSLDDYNNIDIIVYNINKLIKSGVLDNSKMSLWKNSKNMCWERREKLKDKKQI